MILDPGDAIISMSCFRSGSGLLVATGAVDAYENRDWMQHDSREPSHPHDERTFRYLLDLEQRRSDRSGRPFLLVLVDIGTDRQRDIDASVAAMMFSSLSSCLRETDFVGWYEEGRRPGAVLTELGEGSGSDVRKMLSDKVLILLERLPSDLASQLQIRVCPAFRCISEPAVNYTVRSIVGFSDTP